MRNLRTMMMRNHLAETESRQSSPDCQGEELWGNLIRKRRGCYEELEDCDSDEESFS